MSQAVHKYASSAEQNHCAFLLAHTSQVLAVHTEKATAVAAELFTTLVAIFEPLETKFNLSATFKPPVLSNTKTTRTVANISPILIF